jgi:hypothetical protein
VFREILKYKISGQFIQWKPGSFSMRTDGQTGITKLIFAIGKFFIKAPKNDTLGGKNYSEAFEIITKVMLILRKKSIDPASHKNMLIKRFQILQQSYFVANSVSFITFIVRLMQSIVQNLEVKMYVV